MEMIGVIPFLAFYSLLHLAVPYSPEERDYFFQKCPPFDCGKLGKISIPFTTSSRSKACGPFVVDGCDKEHQKIRLDREQGRWYEIENISQSNTMFIYDKEFQNQLNSRQCQAFNNLTLPRFPYAPFGIKHNITLYKCNPAANFSNDSHLLVEHTCKNFTIYSYTERILPSYLPDCSILQLPLGRNPKNDEIFNKLTANFTLEVYHWWPECYWCHLQGGNCRPNSEKKYSCVNKNGKEIPLTDENTKPRRHRGLALKLAGALGLSLAVVLIILAALLIWRYKNIPSTFNSSNLSSKLDMEGHNIYFEVPVLSYTELEEATGNFDPRKELGNGGFGTVYYGKLRDGREVAVKRLYGHDYRRVELFMNEIGILARLRHKNLVSLYGCTSVHSRGLLLVYEYIPNGTVSDHLHSDRASPGSLTWPIRMKIAVETASALAYLHASDIIHRDVKTNNILLDSNYSVKVADFGLSRFFPNDATHISTAPQGTPGYVDPEYHQCYQLTSKSDVYSFGVVLIELISSMPAVDITRHRHEINLANLAINKIQKGALDELIDPCLGYQTNEEINKIITLVAELAFRCLQQDKEMRPSMDEVLEELQRAESEKHDEFQGLDEGHENNKNSKSTELQPCQPDRDEIVLLKNIQVPYSPTSVTHRWLSSSSYKFSY